ncbi:hypothetical protein BDP27DRAFT_1337534 [Rhodocollybia butyracea]|uniref:Transmembrane protein n=1 Tax=Rhodocollybia butyracea TaxID=206335 RepID=A0A9P5TZQ8_9AGAR|nr:hypothetical protein BDP27DRAFT_1337534 [Rhodocollybia butyracea]
MSPPDVWVLIDDTQLAWFGPWVYNTSTNIEIPQNISLRFQGTTASFIGNASSSTNSTGFFASIDSHQPHQVPYPNTSTPVYGKWYQTPMLSDDTHTINLSSITVDLDYVIVFPGPTTPLSGSTIVVDDSNEKEIFYVGHKWTQSTSPINFVGGMRGKPMGSSIHSTCTKGNGFKFQFAGSNISVYGFSEGANTGGISIDFTLDGNTTSYNLSAPVASTVTSQFSTPRRFFFDDNIDAGNHTLQMNVTDSFGNETFIFDYITYVASYSNLGSKPNFTDDLVFPLVASSSLNSTSASTPTSTPASTPTSTPIPTSTPTPTPTLTPVSTATKNVGATVGGVVGGIGVLAIVFVALWLVFLMWRKRRNDRIPRIYNYQPITPRQPKAMPAFMQSTPAQPELAVRHDFITQHIPSAGFDLEPWVIEPLIQADSPIPGMVQARTKGLRRGLSNTTGPPAYS